MFGACEDTICFYLQSAKPSKLQSLTPTELQAQIDLLQSRLESVKSGTWMQPPSVPFSDSDSVSWALSKAKESGLEKLSAGGRQEQMELLEKQLRAAKSVSSGVPIAPVELPPAAASAPVEIPPVASAPPLTPEPPPVAVVPEPAAEAIKSVQEYTQEIELPQADPSGPFGFSVPKLPDFGAAANPSADVTASSSGPFGLSLPSVPKLPDFGGAANPNAASSSSSSSSSSSGGGEKHVQV